MNIKMRRIENEIIDKFKQETESLSKSAKIKGIKIRLRFGNSSCK